MRTLCLIALAACTPGRSGTSSSAPNYELDCAPATTATSSNLQCVRTDTRSGDVVVIDYLRLPTSTGPTAVGNAPAGRFSTVCDSTATTTRADFYCVRLNTESGELLLINLMKVGVLPPRQQ